MASKQIEINVIGIAKRNAKQEADDAKDLELLLNPPKAPPRMLPVDPFNTNAPKANSAAQ